MNNRSTLEQTIASPRKSLKERLTEALAAAPAFPKLYETAEALRDAGLSQVDVYGIFIGLLDQHCTARDQRFEALTDVLDCIWAGGWGKAGPDLFDHPLSESQLGSVSICWTDETQGQSNGQLTIRHGQFLVELPGVSANLIDVILDFCLRNLLQTEVNQLSLGPSETPLVLSKIADSPFQFALSLGVPSNNVFNAKITYDLGYRAIGEFVGGLMRASERAVRKA